MGILPEPDIICPACGSSSWKRSGQSKDYSITGEWFELKECTDCHLLATHPQPSEQQLGRYYSSTNYISHSDTKAGLINKLYHSARSFMMKKKFDWVVNVSSRSTGQLLDVGAGTGHFAKYMQDHGWNVTALEPDSTARKVASEKLGLNVLPIEAMTTLQHESFDVITLWHVLEHVQDINGYLTHFKSLLKPNGVLIIAVPNHTSRDAKQYKGHWAALDVPRHLWHFSPSAILKLLNRNNFSLIKKMPMPLDAFYVSMLSEKYKGNNFLGPACAVLSGFKTFLKGKRNVDNSSSIIYVAQPQH